MNQQSVVPERNMPEGLCWHAWVNIHPGPLQSDCIQQGLLHQDLHNAGAAIGSAVCVATTVHGCRHALKDCR